jgi:hypothetical protein
MPHVQLPSQGKQKGIGRPSLWRFQRAGSPYPALLERKRSSPNDLLMTAEIIDLAAVGI